MLNHNTFPEPGGKLGMVGIDTQLIQSDLRYKNLIQHVHNKVHILIQKCWLLERRGRDFLIILG